MTTAFSVGIQGVAVDDTFVRHIRVGEKDIPIDVSERQISFSSEVPLVCGQNNISVQVTDLTGKCSMAKLSVNVDRTGPLLQIDEPTDGGIIRDAKILFKGNVFDDSGIAELTVNGIKVLYDGVQEIEIDRFVSFQPEEKELLVEVKDQAGNLTHAKIGLVKELKDPSKKAQPSDGQDRTAPVLRVRGMEKEQNTYLDQVFIEGNIRDNEAVGSVFVNGSHILQKPGKNIYFSHIISLEPGLNVITIHSVDLAGNESTVDLKVNRLVLKVHEIGSRLRVAIGELERNRIGMDRQLSYGFEDLLTAAMIDRGRFSVIERQHLRSLLEELKLSQSGLVDEDTALKLGKILAADCMVFGSVLERTDCVEVYARLVDTETAMILAAVDVYGEDVDRDVLGLLSTGVDLKLTQELPVVEGMVVEKNGNRIIVDLCKKSRIKNGMKLIVYQLGEAVLHPQSHRVLGNHFKELAQARIQSVMENMSCAELMEPANMEEIQPQQQVITR